MMTILIIANLLAMICLLIIMVLFFRWYINKHLGSSDKYQIGIALKDYQLDNETTTFLADEAKRDRESYRTEEKL